MCGGGGAELITTGPEQQLAAMVKAEGKVAGKDFAIVDVRGDDYAGGHIKGGIHQCSKTLAHGGIEVIRDKTKNVPTVVFHCLLSQVRFVFLQLSTCPPVCLSACLPVRLGLV
jgi:hypothetical protein